MHLIDLGDSVFIEGENDSLLSEQEFIGELKRHILQVRSPTIYVCFRNFPVMYLSVFNVLEKYSKDIKSIGFEDVNFITGPKPTSKIFRNPFNTSSFLSNTRGISSLPNLEFLSLKRVKNNNILEIVKNSKSLTTLILDTIPNEDETLNIASLQDRYPSLASLDLRKVDSFSFNKTLENTLLTHLEIEECRYLKNVEKIGLFKGLCKLRLENIHNITSLPTVENLKELILKNLSSLYEIPEMERLKDLEVLEIYNCPIQVLNNVSNLTKLTLLYIVNTYLRKISVRNISSLHTIFLDRNHLMEADISNLEELYSLSLSRNCLENFSASEMPKLERLLIDVNPLMSLNLSSSVLESLRCLWVKHTSLKDECRQEILNLKKDFPHISLLI